MPVAGNPQAGAANGGWRSGRALHTFRAMTTTLHRRSTAVVETDIVLRDGSTVHVRPTTPEDEPRLRAFFASLSDESRWFRYFSGGVNLDWAAHTAADPGDGLSLLALSGPEGTVVGHGTYIDRATRPGGDRLRRRGCLARPRDRDRPARASRPVRVLRGHRDVHGHRAVVEPPHAPGVPRLRLPRLERAAPGTRSRSSSRPRCRGRRATTSRSASAWPTSPRSPTSCDPRRSRSSGHRAGRGPSAARSCATSSPAASPARCTSSTRAAARWPAGPTVRSIADVEGDVELAVIAVPAGAVIETARQCAAKGVCALVVLTAGFAEVGPEGRARQDELLAVCRAAGMRMVGPNCLGVANLHHLTSLNATFAPGGADAGQRRVRLPERGVRDRGDRRGGGARDRAVVVRLDGRQGRPLRQRLPRVLGAGPRHVGAARLPRVLRQPAPLRADRAPDHREQADRGGQERPHRGRPSRRVLPHRRPARRLRRDRRRPVRRRRRAARGDGRGDVRRRRAARAPAAAAGRPRGGPDQRGRARDPLRGRLRGRRAADRDALRRHARAARRRSCPPRRRPPTRST